LRWWRIAGWSVARSIARSVAWSVLSTLAGILPWSVLSIVGGVRMGLRVAIPMLLLGLVSVATLVVAFALVVATLVVVFAFVAALIIILSLAVVIGRRSRRSSVSCSICYDSRGKEQSNERKYSLGMHGNAIVTESNAKCRE